MTTEDARTYIYSTIKTEQQNSFHGCRKDVEFRDEDSDVWYVRFALEPEFESSSFDGWLLDSVRLRI